MTSRPQTLDALVQRAQGGDRAALEAVLTQLQDRIYRLALRILIDPDDALDATQEILLRISTHLPSYEGRSAFETWVYRVATNHLLDARRRRLRCAGLTFEDFREDLERGLVEPEPGTAEDAVMLNELRIACTMAMLLCLDVEQRVAYVLGDILGLDQHEASEILGVAEHAYRKRLSRARAQVVAFTAQSCGLANTSARCSCPRRLPAALALGRVSPARLVHAERGAPEYSAVVAQVRQVEGDLKALVLQRAASPLHAPAELGQLIARIVEASPPG